MHCRVLTRVASALLALAVGLAGCSASGARGSGEKFEDLEITKIDRLRSEPWLTDSSRRSADPASIKWRQISDGFAHVTSVSMRPDGSIYVIDAGQLYFSDGVADAWQLVEEVDAHQGCIDDTPSAALLPAPTGEGGFYVERSPGQFELVPLPTGTRVGCSFATFDSQVWGIVDGDTAFVIDIDSIDADYQQVALRGPTNGLVEDLELWPTRFTSSSPPSLLVEVVDAMGLGGAGEAWRWWIDTGIVQVALDGESGATDLRAVGSFSSWSASTEVLSLSGEPGSGFSTWWSGPSAAVLGMGPEGAHLNSLWPIPQHFLETNDEVFAFGAVTAHGSHQIRPVMWRLTSWGWEQFDDAGPGNEVERQIVHQVAAVGNTFIAATCAPNSTDCGAGDVTQLWLGTIFAG